MAKRGVLEHEKTIMLADALGIMEPFAVGILEVFWQWVSKYRPTGDLSGSRPSLMARSIRYTADAQALWDALVQCGFIDIEGQRAIVHDWSDHADDSVHMRLARAVQLFADGTKPSMHRIGAKERAELEAAWALSESSQCLVRTESAQEAHDKRMPSALPKPLPLPMPKPQPKPHAAEPRADAAVDDLAKVVAKRVKFEAPLSGLEVEVAIEVQAQHQLRQGRSADEVADEMIAAWQKYNAARPKLNKPWGAERFFSEGNWRNEAGWPWRSGLGPPATSSTRKPTLSPMEQAHYDYLEQQRKAKSA